MPTFIELTSRDALPVLKPGGSVSPIELAELQRHAPDDHLMLVRDDKTLESRASVWWSQVPSIPQHRVGVVGHYVASTEGAGRAILERACDRLRDAGCTIAVGPMDGNTWRRYRFIVDRGPEPPFFLEPDNPDTWPGHFVSVGFKPLAVYSSALADDIGQEDRRLAKIQDRAARGGLSIRTLNLADVEGDLRRIFSLSLDSFATNYLYTPLSEDEFLEQNRRLLPFVQPDLVLLAEKAGELSGFLFGVPDVLQKQRGGSIDTLIIKTVAVSPRRAGMGLGALLVAVAHQNAARLGFRRAIHALMHEQNVSQNISRRYARTIRRYALFARSL